jgi:hypothetical protein
MEPAFCFSSCITDDCKSLYIPDALFVDFCSQCQQRWPHWLFKWMPLSSHELAAVHWSQDSWLSPSPTWISQNIWFFRNTGSCRTFAQLCLQAGDWQLWSCNCEAEDGNFASKLANCYVYASFIVLKIPMHEIAASYQSSISRMCSVHLRCFSIHVM